MSINTSFIENMINLYDEDSGIEFKTSDEQFEDYFFNKRVKLFGDVKKKNSFQVLGRLFVDNSMYMKTEFSASFEDFGDGFCKGEFFVDKDNKIVIGIRKDLINYKQKKYFDETNYKEYPCLMERISVFTDGKMSAFLFRIHEHQSESSLVRNEDVSIIDENGIISQRATFNYTSKGELEWVRDFRTGKVFDSLNTTTGGRKRIFSDICSELEAAVTPQVLKQTGSSKLTMSADNS